MSLGRSPRRAVLAITLAALAGMALSTRAAAPAGGLQTRFTVPHVPAQMLVKLAPGTSQNDLETALAAFGATVAVFSGAPAELYVVDLAADSMLAAAVALLEADLRFELAQPNYLYAELARPNEPNFAQQWSKENTGVNGPGGLGTIGADMNMVEAWDTQRTAPGVVLAIIDDAVETTHLDLIGNLLTTGKCFAAPGSARPCTNGANDPSPADSGDFHGTLVTGAAAARGNNGLGVAGTVWETSVLPLKVDLSSYAIVKAIDEAINQGADIINMSFGGPIKDTAQEQALARSAAAGIVVVASAGNADASNDRASHHPSNSAQPNVLSIAATTGTDTIAGFSQWGSFGVDVAAPGVEIRTTAINNGYAAASGTSFSSPHIAGVAALVKAHTSAADYRRVKAHLLYGGINGVTALGPVTPGQSKTAVPGRVATGRIDAARALTGPSGGVIVVRSVTVDDTLTGNGNGRLDPGETALLEITIRNAWLLEAAVAGTLSTPNSTLLAVNDVQPVSFGAVAQDAEATAKYSVTLLNTVSGNQQIFFELDLNSASPAGLPSRYFYLEVGTLANGSTVTQQIQRWDWDEFQHFHVSVPVGATNLRVQTTGSGDIDLLLRATQPPEYLITLAGDGFYYVDAESQVSAGPGASESITVTSPLPGLYHAVVVNFDQAAKTYQLTASYDTAGANQVAFAANTLTVGEGAGNVVVTVNRSGAIGAASVDYATATGTATPGSDYTNVSGTLTWATGENGPKTFTIPILEDTVQESVETINVALANASGTALATPSTATVQVTDNDGSGGSGGGTTTSGGGGGAIGAGHVLLLLLLAGAARLRAPAAVRRVAAHG